MIQKILGKLQASGTFRGIVTSASWLITKHIVALLTSILVGAWVSRYLGPSDYGVLSLAVTIAALLRPLRDLGLRMVVHRAIAQNAAAEEHLLGTVVLVRLLGGLCMLPLGLAVLQLYTHAHPMLWLMVLLTLSAQIVQVADVFEHIFMARNQAQRFAWAAISAEIVGAVLNIAFILVAASVWWFAATHLLRALALALLLYVLWRQISPLVRWRYELSSIPGLLRQGGPWLLAAFLGQGVALSDKLMIGALTNTTELGYYAVATLMTFAPAFLFPSIGVAVTNHLVQSQNAHHHALFIQVMVGLGVMMTAGFLLTAPWLVWLLFGAAYAPAAAQVQILSCALAFYGVAHICHVVLLARQQERYIPIFSGLALAVNVVLNALFIPHFGGNGAAIATVLSSGVGFLGGLLVFPATRDVGKMVLHALYGRYALQFLRVRTPV